MDNLREFLIWTLVVPALLLSLSVWQTFRAVNNMARDAQYSAELAEDIPVLQEMLVTYPQAIIRFKVSGVQQPAAEALEEALQGQQHLERIAGQREITLCVAVLGVVSSFAVIIAGLIGLWGIREVRRASMRSRATLVQSFSLWQGRLAIVLCVLAGGLCCAVVSAVGFEFWDDDLRNAIVGSSLVGKVKVSIFMVTVFFMGVYAVYKIWKAWRSLFVPYVQQMQGQEITPEACPALWELVRGVAKRAGAQPPDAIILGMETSFFIMAGDVDLYPEGKRCSGNLLYLSLPFMTYLTREELSSVVAHELGHYAGEDLEYSQRFLPIYVGTRRQLAALHDVEENMESPLSRLALEPATMLVRNFFDALDSGVKFWSRQRELAADEVSSTVVGPYMAAATLLRVVALSPALDDALEQWADVPSDEDEDEYEGQGDEGDEDYDEYDEATESEPAAESETLVQLAGRPDGVLTFVRSAVQEQGLADPRDALEDTVPHPLDTHPLTTQRLQAWGVDVNETLVCHAMRLEESSLLWEFGLLQEEKDEA